MFEYQLSHLFLSPHFSNFLCLVCSLFLLHTCLHTPAHTHSHLCWGGVLYFINSRLYAKIHYASLLFSRTQACQLTCGTNFSLPPSPFLPHSPPPLLLISMFRMWFTCIKGSLGRGPLCIAGPWLVITVKPSVFASAAMLWSQKVVVSEMQIMRISLHSVMYLSC